MIFLPILFMLIPFFIILRTIPQFSEPFSFNVFIILLIVCILLTYIWARLSYHFYRYELTKEGFRKESGVISKSYVTIPYNRIQNVDIYRGVMARLLGLSSLWIQTAGISGMVRAEGLLPG